MDFKHIIKTNKCLQFALLLTFNVIVFILFANIFPIRFLTNDDICMAWIANGVTTGTPDCHLVFMHAIYGSFLAFLYNIVPNIEWYSVCFAVFHVVAISIIITFFYKKLQNKLIRWVVICLYYLLWFRIIQFFQFTTTTAMLAFSGILLLCDRKYVIGGVLFLVSCMLRFGAAGLIGLLSIPLFVKFYHFEIKKYIPIAIILLVICGVHLSDKLFYQSAEWQDYCEYNHYRAIINDSPNNWILNQSELPDNVSKENLQLLRDCNADPCQISNADMKEMAEIINATPFLQKCHNLPYSIKHYPFYKLYLGFFLLMCVLFLFGTDGICNKVFISFAFFLFIGVIWYISLNGNIKPRIVESICFVLFSYILLISDSLNIVFSKKRYFVVVPLFMACGILFIHECSYMRTRPESNIEEQIQLITKTNDLKIVNLNPDFQIEQLSPFSLYKFPRTKFISSGWLVKSPFCEIHSFKETVDSNIAFIIKGYSRISDYQNAIKRNYNIETDLDTIVNAENYAIVSLHSKRDN